MTGSTSPVTSPARPRRAATVRSSNGSSTSGLPDERTFVLWRGQTLRGAAEHLPLHDRPSDGAAPPGRGRPRRPATRRVGRAVGRRAAGGAGAARRLPAGGHQRRRQPGHGGRCRGARPPPRPRAAPLVGRHQLHDLAGRDPGAARVAGADAGGKLRAAWPEAGSRPESRGAAGSGRSVVADEPPRPAGTSTADEPDARAASTPTSATSCPPTSTCRPSSGPTCSPTTAGAGCPACSTCCSPRRWWRCGRWPATRRS